MKNVIKPMLFFSILGFLLVIPYVTNAENVEDYGPFEAVYFDAKIAQNKLAIISTHTDKEDLNYVIYNNEKFGPLKYMSTFKVSDYAWGVIQNRGEYFIVNNEKYGPYEYGLGDDLQIYDNFYGFKFGKDEKYYVNLNGTILGPYDSIGNLYIGDNVWIFSFSKDEKYFVNASGEIFETFSSHLYLSNNHYLIDVYGGGAIADGKKYDHSPQMYSKMVNDYGWGYIYTQEDGQYVLYNGKSFGPYDQFGMYREFVLVGEDWYLSYTMNDEKKYIKNGDFKDSDLKPEVVGYTDKFKRVYRDKKNYIVINDVEYGPYSMISNPVFDGEKWLFLYRQENNLEYYIKTNITNALNRDLVELESADNEIILSQKDSKETQEKEAMQISGDLYFRLKGKIILKTEDAGKAYYIHPGKQTMHYLGRPQDAFNVMRDQGVGIKNIDLYKIPVGINEGGVDSDMDGLPDNLENALGLNINNSDTDEDGFNDRNELVNEYNPWGTGKQGIDNGFADNQKGKILLQVEKKGEAWYVNPSDGKRYFLGRPQDAFNIMRVLGLGISNTDFDAM